MLRAPLDLPPILSVDLIEITDTTSIPFAAKAAKTLEKIKKKEEEKRVVSEQAPPSEKKKEKPDRIPLPEDLNKEKKQIVKKKQNPEEIKEQITSASFISQLEEAAATSKAVKDTAITGTVEEAISGLSTLFQDTFDIPIVQTAEEKITSKILKFSL